MFFLLHLQHLLLLDLKLLVRFVELALGLRVTAAQALLELSELLLLNQKALPISVLVNQLRIAEHVPIRVFSVTNFDLLRSDLEIRVGRHAPLFLAAGQPVAVPDEGDLPSPDLGLFELGCLLDHVDLLVLLDELDLRLLPNFLQLIAQLVFV